MLIVKDLMSKELYTLKATDTVHQARELMLNKHIRYIPILNDNNEFVGLLTKRDVLAVSISTLADIEQNERDTIEDSIPIAEVMRTDLIVANEETHLLEAARFILNQKHGCLPVFRDTQLVGILTEADFVRLAVYLLEKEED